MARPFRLSNLTETVRRPNYGARLAPNIVNDRYYPLSDDPYYNIRLRTSRLAFTREDINAKLNEFFPKLEWEGAGEALRPKLDDQDANYFLASFMSEHLEGWSAYAHRQASLERSPMEQRRWMELGSYERVRAATGVPLKKGQTPPDGFMRFKSGDKVAYNPAEVNAASHWGAFMQGGQNTEIFTGKDEDKQPKRRQLRGNYFQLALGDLPSQYEQMKAGPRSLGRNLVTPMKAALILGGEIAPSGQGYFDVPDTQGRGAWRQRQHTLFTDTPLPEGSIPALGTKWGRGEEVSYAKDMGGFQDHWMQTELVDRFEFTPGDSEKGKYGYRFTYRQSIPLAEMTGAFKYLSTKIFGTQRDLSEIKDQQGKKLGLNFIAGMKDQQGAAIQLFNTALGKARGNPAAMQALAKDLGYETKDGQGDPLQMPRTFRQQGDRILSKWWAKHAEEYVQKIDVPERVNRQNMDLVRHLMVGEERPVAGEADLFDVTLRVDAIVGEMGMRGSMAWGWKGASLSPQMVDSLRRFPGMHDEYRSIGREQQRPYRSALLAARQTQHPDIEIGRGRRVREAEGMRDTLGVLLFDAEKQARQYRGLGENDPVQVQDIAPFFMQSLNEMTEEVDNGAGGTRTRGIAGDFIRFGDYGGGSTTVMPPRDLARQSKADLNGGESNAQILAFTEAARALASGNRSDLQTALYTHPKIDKNGLVKLDRKDNVVMAKGLRDYALGPYTAPESIKKATYTRLDKRYGGGAVSFGDLGLYGAEMHAPGVGHGELMMYTRAPSPYKWESLVARNIGDEQYAARGGNAKQMAVSLQMQQAVGGDFDADTAMFLRQQALEHPAFVTDERNRIMMRDWKQDAKGEWSHGPDTPYNAEAHLSNMVMTQLMSGAGNIFAEFPGLEATPGLATKIARGEALTAEERATIKGNVPTQDDLLGKMKAMALDPTKVTDAKAIELYNKAAGMYGAIGPVYQLYNRFREAAGNDPGKYEAASRLMFTAYGYAQRPDMQPDLLNKMRMLSYSRSKGTGLWAHNSQTGTTDQLSRVSGISGIRMTLNEIAMGMVRAKGEGDDPWISPEYFGDLYGATPEASAHITQTLKDWQAIKGDPTSAQRRVTELALHDSNLVGSPKAFALQSTAGKVVAGWVATRSLKEENKERAERGDPELPFEGGFRGSGDKHAVNLQDLLDPEMDTAASQQLLSNYKQIDAATSLSVKKGGDLDVVAALQQAAGKERVYLGDNGPETKPPPPPPLEPGELSWADDSGAGASGGASGGGGTPPGGTATAAADPGGKKRKPRKKKATATAPAAAAATPDPAPEPASGGGGRERARAARRRGAGSRPRRSGSGGGYGRGGDGRADGEYFDSAAFGEAFGEKFGHIMNNRRSRPISNRERVSLLADQTWLEDTFLPRVDELTAAANGPLEPEVKRFLGEAANRIRNVDDLAARTPPPGAAGSAVKDMQGRAAIFAKDAEETLNQVRTRQDKVQADLVDYAVTGRSKFLRPLTKKLGADLAAFLRTPGGARKYGPVMGDQLKNYADNVKSLRMPVSEMSNLRAMQDSLDISSKQANIERLPYDAKAQDITVEAFGASLEKATAKLEGFSGVLDDIEKRSASGKLTGRDWEAVAQAQDEAKRMAGAMSALGDNRGDLTNPARVSLARHQARMLNLESNQAEYGAKEKRGVRGAMNRMAGLGDVGWAMFNAQRWWRWTGGLVTGAMDQYAGEQMRYAQGEFYATGNAQLPQATLSTLQRAARQEYATSQLGKAGHRVLGPILDTLSSGFMNATQGQQNALAGTLLGVGGLGIAGLGLPLAVGRAQKLLEFSAEHLVPRFGARVGSTVAAGMGEMALMEGGTAGVGTLGAGSALGIVGAGLALGTANVAATIGLTNEAYTRAALPNASAYDRTIRQGEAWAFKTNSAGPGPLGNLSAAASRKLVPFLWNKTIGQTEAGQQAYDFNMSNPATRGLMMNLGFETPEEKIASGTATQDQYDKINRAMIPYGLGPEASSDLYSALALNLGRAPTIAEMEQAAGPTRLSGASAASATNNAGSLARATGALPGTPAYNEQFFRTLVLKPTDQEQLGQIYGQIADPLAARGMAPNDIEATANRYLKGNYTSAGERDKAMAFDLRLIGGLGAQAGTTAGVITANFLERSRTARAYGGDRAGIAGASSSLQSLFGDELSRIGARDLNGSIEARYFDFFANEAAEGAMSAFDAQQSGQLFAGTRGLAAAFGHIPGTQASDTFEWNLGNQTIRTGKPLGYAEEQWLNAGAGALAPLREYGWTADDIKSRLDRIPTNERTSRTLSNILDKTAGTRNLGAALNSPAARRNTQAVDALAKRLGLKSKGDQDEIAKLLERFGGDILNTGTATQIGQAVAGSFGREVSAFYGGMQSGTQTSINIAQDAGRLGLAETAGYAPGSTAAMRYERSFGSMNEQQLWRSNQVNGSLSGIFASRGLTIPNGAARRIAAGSLSTAAINQAASMWNTQQGWAFRQQAAGGNQMNAFGGQGWQAGGMEYSPQFGLQQYGTSDAYDRDLNSGRAQHGIAISSAARALTMHAGQVAYTGTMRGFEDRSITLNRGYQEQQFGFARQSAALSFEHATQSANQSYRHGLQSLDLQERQAQTSRRYQQADMTANVYQAGRRVDWQRQDMAYQESLAGLNYGWQQEDMDRSIRFASGRQRQDLIRQRDRSQISYSLETGQRSKERDRFEEQTQWQEEGFARQKQQIEEINALQDEGFQMQRQQLTENFQLQMRQLTESYALQKEKLDADETHTREMWELEDEQRVVEREWQDKQLADQKIDLENRLALAKLAASDFEAEMDRRKTLLEQDKLMQDDLLKFFMVDGRLTVGFLDFIKEVEAALRAAIAGAKTPPVAGPPTPPPSGYGSTPNPVAGDVGLPGGGGTQSSQFNATQTLNALASGQSGGAHVQVFLGNEDITGLLTTRIVSSSAFESGLNTLARRQRNRT